MRRIGILYPGEMGAAVGAALVAAGFEVCTWVGERSARTRRNAASARLARRTRFEDVVRETDAVISLVPPAQALPLAQRFAACVAGSRRAAPVYVDANSISPLTLAEIAARVAAAGAECVDGALVGRANRVGDGTRLLLSGPRAEELGRAWSEALDVRVLDKHLGSASALKMCFAAFNKGLVALFLETASAAGCAGRTGELLELFEAFYPGTLNTVQRLLPSYPQHVSRRVEEMAELERWLGEIGHARSMAAATRESFERLAAARLGGAARPAFRELLDRVIRLGVLRDAAPGDPDAGPRES